MSESLQERARHAAIAKEQDRVHSLSLVRLKHATRLRQLLVDVLNIQGAVEIRFQNDIPYAYVEGYYFLPFVNADEFVDKFCPDFTLGVVETLDQVDWSSCPFPVDELAHLHDWAERIKRMDDCATKIESRKPWWRFW